VILACFAAAAILAGLVVAVALRQHRVEAPGLAPILVGTDHAQASAAPSPAAPPPAEASNVRAAAQPPAPPAARPSEAPGEPSAQARALAKARMLAALRQVPHGVVTLSVEDDAIAQAAARQLADLFREAGWTVDQSSAFGSGPPRRGLAAAFGVSPADEAVREAFDAVGVQFAPPPPDAGIVRTPEIFIGTR
jgi:hypothetical protein